MSRSHDSFGVGAGEGLAAVRGHQSGAKGMLAVKPVFSREIEKISDPMIPLPGTSSVFMKKSCKILPLGASKSKRN